MNIITITEAAAEHLSKKIAAQTPAPEAVLVSVTSKGCSGMRYDLQFLAKLSDAPKGSDVVTQHGITVAVDPRAGLYITGSKMDYHKDQMSSGIHFENPNETGRCGCGESFTTGTQPG